MKNCIMLRKIGIMQGRLSPPVGEAIQAFPADRWREEFSAAHQAGLHHIEWIFDGEDLANPVASPSGWSEMRALSLRTGVKVNSLCADYFMSYPLLQGPEAERIARAEKLAWLITRCAAADIHHIVLPFVDRSRIETSAERDLLLRLLRSLSPLLAEHAIELHLETSLPPEPFARFLRDINDPLVKINYDLGNSASLGFDLAEEFAAYGPHIGSIHIKDRLKGGTTVPLGRGDVDFPAFVRLIDEIDYQGDFVLQVARGKPGEEISWARHNLDFLRGLLPEKSKSWISA
jgi:hexulose-6-phosphate isomerase